MRLQFPALGEDLDDAFDNAFSAGIMQREDQKDLKTFWARFEYLASDVEDDKIIGDWFYNTYTDQYTRVLRKDGST